MALEACLEYIENDELVEITPKNIRIRKTLPRGLALSENQKG
jgi:predicted membrane GTPase involved in stress response